MRHMNAKFKPEKQLSTFFVLRVCDCEQILKALITIFLKLYIIQGSPRGPRSLGTIAWTLVC